MSFNAYLKRQEQTFTSIASCERTVNRFLEWSEKQSIKPEEVTYQDLLLYMKDCQTNGTTQRTVQHYLNMIKHYYNYLVEQGSVVTNPVDMIKVQGVKRKTLYSVFKPEQLHDIYNSFEVNSLTDKRDRVMLGLLVFQGLKTTELGNLIVDQVNLRDGVINVPGGRKSNARRLYFEPQQVMDMSEYVNNVRKVFVEQSDYFKPQLFIGSTGGDNVVNFTHYMLVKLGRHYPGIQNPKHIRASVIVNWLRQYNLRKVQYMAGHRFISSTEAYQQNNMEGLTEEVNRFHPMG